MKKKIRINHTLKKQCNMIIGTVSVYKENVCKKCLKNLQIYQCYQGMEYSLFLSSRHKGFEKHICLLRFVSFLNPHLLKWVMRKQGKALKGVIFSLRINYTWI